MQFPDVAGPVVANEGVELIGTQAQARPFQIFCALGKEGFREQGDILPAFAQRRRFDGEDVEAVVQILSEAASPKSSSSHTMKFPRSVKDR